MRAPQQVDREGRPWPGYLNRTVVVWPSMPFMDLEDVDASPDMALNQVALHPPALAVVAQLLETSVEDLRLSQCALRARYGQGDDAQDTGDQPYHVVGNQLQFVVLSSLFSLHASCPH